MNELLISILLMIPPAEKAIAWDYGAVHNQVQLLHKNGLEVSYSAIRVGCHTEAQKPGIVIYRTDAVCYLTDINFPVMVRYRNQWLPAMSKTYLGK